MESVSNNITNVKLTSVHGTKIFTPGRLSLDQGRMEFCSGTVQHFTSELTHSHFRHNGIGCLLDISYIGISKISV